MFVRVVMVVLSVSFCLSDGCEGQSLLVVSQNGLSLSLASLFSGICRLDVWARLHSCTHTVYWGSAALTGSWWLLSKRIISAFILDNTVCVCTRSCGENYSNYVLGTMQTVARLVLHVFHSKKFGFDLLSSFNADDEGNKCEPTNPGQWWIIEELEYHSIKHIALPRPNRPLKFYQTAANFTHS